MRTLKIILQALFYSLVLAFLSYRAVSSGISHDENQFVAAGQFVADHGLLPYRDFPYTHMPYGLIFYGLTARVSPYDYLAGRLLGAAAWWVCILLMIAITRLIGRKYSASEPTYGTLFGEFTLVLIFLFHPTSTYVLGAALNHSYATLFSLLSLFLFLRGVCGISSLRAAALSSGACVAIAGLIRFNYASLVVVVVALWVVYILMSEKPRPFRLLAPLGGGILAASLPALVLAAVAPAPIYYGNLVYIRLNTLYYEGINYRLSMDLPSKLGSFFGGLLHHPLDLLLYGILLLVGIACLVRFVRGHALVDLIGLAVAAFAATLLLTAFSPTPTQAHYFFAPLPFMLIGVAWLAWELYLRGWQARIVLFFVLLLTLFSTVKIPDQLRGLPDLWHPSEWTPLQVHDFAASLKQYVPQGRMLTLFSMIPMDAGYDAYPFTATGPFSWRTSLLLTPDRRAYYGVTSPDELPKLLGAAPPAGILTGFEAPNAGFTQGDLGGLETPFSDYAKQHGYEPVPLSPRFLEHTIVLWVKQP